MAQFEISVAEYRKWHHMDGTRTWKSYLARTIALGVLVASLLVGQYAFGILWGGLLTFLYFSIVRGVPKAETNRMNSPFALGPFNVVLGPDSYQVRVGASELRLDLREFGFAHDFGDYYRLDHKSGNRLCLPKRALSEEETQLIESYRKRFPGRPEKSTFEMVYGKGGITRP